MMLNKDYSTATILMAANVLDGGKALDKVPEIFKPDVVELMKSQGVTVQPAISVDIKGA